MKWLPLNNCHLLMLSAAYCYLTDGGWRPVSGAPSLTIRRSDSYFREIVEKREAWWEALVKLLVLVCAGLLSCSFPVEVMGVT